jgi:hypothetical protein
MKRVFITRGLFCLVDDDDYPNLIKRQWQASSSRDRIYAIRTDGWKESKKTVRMHRFIMKAKSGEQVDHINGNTLDNRKQNLRICNNEQNGWNKKTAKNNTSGYKGVVFEDRRTKKKWRARIRFKGKVISLKYHTTKEEAASAYNKAAKKYFGEYSKLNFIPQ